MKNAPIISMKKICKSFPLEIGGEQQVLFDITFTIKSGEFGDYGTVWFWKINMYEYYWCAGQCDIWNL